MNPKFEDWPRKGFAVGDFLMGCAMTRRDLLWGSEWHPLARCLGRDLE
jgi:hypothetical protein